MGDSYEAEVTKTFIKPADAHNIVVNEDSKANEQPKEAAVHVPPAKPVSKYFN